MDLMGFDDDSMGVDGDFMGFMVISWDFIVDLMGFSFGEFTMEQTGGPRDFSWRIFPLFSELYHSYSLTFPCLMVGDFP